MSGYCLCGDPYCPSCGNPGAAQWEEFIEKALERFGECQDGTKTPEEALEVFLERNIDWPADSFNESVRG